MRNDKILKDLSINLALYFKLGCISNYNKFIETLESNFQFRDKEAEWVTEELNKKPQSPIDLMYNRYKQRMLTDFERDIIFCKSVILDIYEFKKKPNE